MTKIQSPIHGWQDPANDPPKPGRLVEVHARDAMGIPVTLTGYLLEHGVELVGIPPIIEDERGWQPGHVLEWNLLRFTIVTD